LFLLPKMKEQTLSRRLEEKVSELVLAVLKLYWSQQEVEVLAQEVFLMTFLFVFLLKKIVFCRFNFFSLLEDK
jgi:hypothetical protein